MKKINLLDCTLRDGGYVNDWNFSRESYNQITYGLEQAGIDIIELGIMGLHSDMEFKTKYHNLQEISLPINKNPDTLFTVMLVSTDYSKFTIPKYELGMVNAIRLAFFKSDYKDAMIITDTLQKKGYRVFLQAMATFMYSADELISMINEVNRVKPSAFYMVDSFGTMYPEDVVEMYRNITSILDSSILLGFHAHNNIQMANANAIQFIQCSEDREIAIDASIFGMGRGAGNAGMEILTSYLSKLGYNYNSDIIWSLYNQYIKPIYEQYGWGYKPEQFLASKHHVNPAYLWYLSRKGVTEFEQIERIILQIPEEKRYTLHKDIVDNIIASERG